MEKNIRFVVRAVLSVSALIAVISLYLIIYYQSPQKPVAGQGNLVEESTKLGGDFELIDQNGHPYSNKQLLGRPSLIYFGFTFCPDICPASLHKMMTVLDTLEKYHLDITPVFITIDPERDTPKLLKEYLAHFHHSMVGLTGSLKDIQAVAGKFKVYYSKSEASSEPKAHNASYMMDHSSFIYYLNKQGNFEKLFYMSSSPEEIIEYVRVNYHRN